MDHSSAWRVQQSKPLGQKGLSPSDRRSAMGGKEIFHDPWRELQTENLSFPVLPCNEYKYRFITWPYFLLRKCGVAFRSFSLSLPIPLYFLLVTLLVCIQRNPRINGETLEIAGFIR